MNSEALLAITTPLALAALCLLLGTGLLKVIVKAKTTPVLRMSIRWGFTLALSLGVLANVSYVVTASFAREVRIAGTVRDDVGRPLSRAVADIPGRGRGITDDYGAFEFSIPDSRQADTYEVIVTLDGYSTATVSLKGPRPKETISVALTRPRLTAEAMIKLPTNLRVSHYLGIPQVDVTLNLFNPMPQRIEVNGISVALDDPDGKRVAIPMYGFYMPMGNQLAPPLPLLTIEKGQAWAPAYCFFPGESDAYDLMRRASIEFPATSAAPAPDQRIFSPGLVRQLEAFTLSRMIWRPGDWKLVVTGTVENEVYSRSFRFSLTDEDVRRMKAVTGHLASGAGVLLINRLPQFSDASASILCAIRE